MPWSILAWRRTHKLPAWLGPAWFRSRSRSTTCNSATALPGRWAPRWPRRSTRLDTMPEPGYRSCCHRMLRWRSRVHSRPCRRPLIGEPLAEPSWVGPIFGSTSSPRSAATRSAMPTAHTGSIVSGRSSRASWPTSPSWRWTRRPFRSASSARLPSTRRGSAAGQSTCREASRARDFVTEEVVDAVIVGAGQAGLSLSHELVAAGRAHVVLERGRIGETWRGRWDSFCLVIPNWTVQLPGGRYRGDDPDGFMPKREIVGHLAAYAESFRAPVREGVTVTSLERGANGTFLLRTTAGEIRAKDVVLASGGYQKPHRPPAATQLPASVHAIDAEAYANPNALPPGKVLIVGSGQTGCQLAEEIFEAGREVSLACGRAPWIPRRLEGRDTIAWINDTPYFDARLTDLPSPAARLLANPQMSGRRGGHDLNFRTLQAQGVQLLGHFVGVSEGRAHFADDLAESVAFGDTRFAQISELIRKTCAAASVRAPHIAPPAPFVGDAQESVALRDVGAVIFTSGFRPDYASWVRFPQAFDEGGFPIQQDGSSSTVPGLHFMGVHFQRKRKSATFLGVGEDATVLAETIAGR